MPTVLLFGSGQIGVFAARAMGKQGFVVHAADASPDTAFYARYGPGTDASPPVEVDVTQCRDVETFVRSHSTAAAVVFAAGYTGGRATAEPAAARVVAERGVTNVLATAHAVGIRRAVVVSSLAVYGNVFPADRLTVAGPAVPNTTYGQIQLALENHARAFVGDIDIAILRTAGVFGPKRFGFGSHSARFVERMLFAAAIGHPVQIAGRWEDEDDLVYVKDVGEAISKAISRSESGSLLVNVGLGRVSTLREIADAVLALFPKAKITLTPIHGSQAPSRRRPLDITTLLTRLGMKPAFSLSTAVRDYAVESGLLDAR